MRVVHIGKYYWPYQRGIETYLKTLAEGLGGRCETIVIVSNEDRETVEEEVNGVRVIRLKRAFKLAGTDFLFSLPAKLKELKPDIVHVHLPNPWAETAWKLAGRPGRLFVSFHSDIIRQKFLLFFYAPFHRAFLKQAEKIIVATPNHIEYSPFLSKLPPEKLAVVHYGLKKEEYASPSQEIIAEFKRKYAPYVFSVGQLVYYKGFDVLIKALAETKELDLLIAGVGPLLGKLKKQAANLGLADRVTFLGHIPQEELLAAYHGCEFFVLPSTFRSEAFGLVQLEAFLAGKAVVSTDLRSGVPYVNQNGVTGIVAPPGDAKALAGAMRSLHGDPELRSRMGEAGRQRALRDFSAEDMVEKTFRLYLGE